MKLTLILFSFFNLCVLQSCSDRNSDNFEPEAEGLTYIKLLGGNNPDIGRSIQRNGDGYILSGWTESKGAGLRDMWLVNIDSAGQIIWDKTFGDNNNDWAYYATVTSDNNIIFCGRTSTGNVPGGASGAVPTIYVAKADSLGNEIWHMLLGPSLYSRIAYQVLETGDHGFIVLAYHNNADLITNTEGPSLITLYRLDADGNQLWEFTYNEWTTGYSIAIAVDGSYVIAGNLEEERETQSPTESRSDLLVIRVNDSGELLWEKQFDYSDWDLAKSIKSTQDGFIITGQTGSFQSGELDLLLLKIDESGNELWHTVAGGSYSDRGNDVIETTFGDYVVVGSTFSYDSGNGDVWLLKFSSDGNLIWSRSIGSDQLDIAYSVTEAKDFGYVLIGETDSFQSVLTDVLVIKTDKNGRVKRNETGQFIAF
ncbi:MAG: hypothetical protein KDD94_05270 [Calditrichaeota bacterium]|nr:hypothetical protein [Calditrichota bacterium]